MRQIKKGSTNISVDVYIIDAVDGTPETGVLYTESGIDLEYRREGSAVVDITEATLASLVAAHSDGGFLEIGHGYYRLDIPDAAFATGANTVSIQGTITGMVVLPQTIQLVDFDPEDATRLGLTALPDANAAAAGGLPISAAGGLDLDALNTNVNDIETDLANGTDGLGALKTAIDTVDTVVDGIQTDLSNGTDGLGALKTLIDAVDTIVDSILVDTGTTLDGKINTIDTVVDGIQTDLSNGTDGLGALKILIDAIDTVVDTILLDTGELQTDWMNGGRLDLILDAINAKTTNLPADPAGETSIAALQADIDHGTYGLSALENLVDTVETSLDHGTYGLSAIQTLISGLQDLSSADVLTTALTESYAADGSTATLSQLLYMIWSILNELSISGTSATSYKLDGSTSAMTFTLDDATDPTKINRNT